MLIGGKRRTVHTIEVYEQDVPAVGRQLKDPRGRKWTIRGRWQKLGLELSNPPAPFPPWYLEIEAEHPAYAISVGEELTPIFTLDDVRTARDAARTTFPQLRSVGASDDNQSLIFFVSSMLDAVDIPTVFHGMPVTLRVVTQ